MKSLFKQLAIICSKYQGQVLTSTEDVRDVSTPLWILTSTEDVHGVSTPLWILTSTEDVHGVSTPLWILTSTEDVHGVSTPLWILTSTEDVHGVSTPLWILTSTEDVHGVVEVLLYGPVHSPVLPLVRASTSASALRRRHDVADFTSAVKRQTYPWKQRTATLWGGVCLSLPSMSSVY